METKFDLHQQEAYTLLWLVALLKCSSGPRFAKTKRTHSLDSVTSRA